MSGTTLTFLPWVRQGAAGLISTQDGPAATLKARAAFSLTVSLNQGAAQGGADVPVSLRLYGPGDVNGLDPNQIIRVEPAPNSANFEPNYLAFIEFDDPSLPWLFTPAAAPTSDRLRPWICLVVVESAQVSLRSESSRPLPYLKIPAGTPLPNLSESWAWAHAQIGGTDVGTALDSKPELTLSRLVCPRRLDPNTSYMAAVVPAFDIGVRAGLGQAQDDATNPNLGPAWTGTPAIDLPVYFHWEFSTGPGGDFEALVTRLKRVAGTDVQGLGARQVVVSNPGAGLPVINDNSTPPAPQVLSFAGALVAAHSAAAEPSYPSAFTEALRSLVNFPGTSSSLTALPAGLAVAPPIYGRWHAAQSAIPVLPPAVGVRNIQWLRDLNLKPHHRAAASLGTRIVQDKQEDLMASAWNQVGEIEKANQLLRQAQMARDSAKSRFANIQTLPDTSLMHLAGPVLARVSIAASMAQPAKLTAHGNIAASYVPQACFTGAFRRAARPRGRSARRIGRLGGGGDLLATRLVAIANAPDSTVGRLPNPAGMVSLSAVLKKAYNGTAEARKLCQISMADLRARLAASPAPGAAEATLLKAFTPLLAKMAPCAQPVNSKVPLDIAGIASTLRTKLNPERTIAKLMAKLVTAPGWNPSDALEPIMAAPEFPTPMYAAAAAVSQDYLLAGLEHLPPDSITGVQTNPGFIAAFMAGLNHEMSRELLWRGYPTDQRGTYFRQFWDPATRVPAPATAQELENAKDIDPMSQWSATAAMSSGARSALASSGQTVLVMRGELLRRYPCAALYAVAGEWYSITTATNQTLWRRRPKTTTPEQFERYPIFKGSLEPDALFAGFALPPEDAIGRQVNAQGNPVDEQGSVIVDPVTDDKAGWFVVLQQQPTEPRFGLDETGTSPAAGWNDLGWDKVVLSGHHLAVGSALANFTASPGSGFNPTWPPSTSAVMASIALQGPFRAAIHLSDLLGVA